MSTSYFDQIAAVHVLQDAGCERKLAEAIVTILFRAIIGIPIEDPWRTETTSTPSNCEVEDADASP